MIAALLALVIGPASLLEPNLARSPHITLAEVAPLRGQLREALATKLKAMNDADHGIFHDDISPIVAPYFPKGQTFAETKAVLGAQNLGSLRRFHGKGDGTGSAIYVSRVELIGGPFADVHVVIDFDFEGVSEPEMILQKVNAYLEAPSM